MQQSSDKIYRKPEKEKKRKYAARVMEIEHGTFTRPVYSITGDIVPECSTYHKHLASKIAEKTGSKYEMVLTLIRTKLSFLIMKAAPLCNRGNRSISSKHQNTIEDDYDMVFEDLRLC